MDDIGAALEAAEAEARAIDAALELTGDSDDDDTPESLALVRAGGAVSGFARMLDALKALPVLRLETADERQLAVSLWNTLTPVEEAVSMHTRRIEASFRRVAEQEQADRLVLGDGRVVEVKQKQAEYRVDAVALRNDLLGLAAKGVLTREQVDEAVRVEVSTIPDHGKLNVLAAHHGQAVRDAIEKHRTKVPGGPGKVVIPK